MAYPPIPRDVNGALLPVRWDKNLGTWVVYEGVAVEIENVDLTISEETDLAKEETLQNIANKDFAKEETLEDVRNGIDAIINTLNNIKGTMETHNLMTLFGADLADRPSADSVAVGTTFTLANGNLDTWISDGTDWMEV